MTVQATPATLAQNTYALDKVLGELRSLSGPLNGNDAILSDAATRINALAGSAGVSAAVKGNAQALATKAKALAAVQKDVEGATSSIINAASALRSDMETNPLYSFLQTPSTDWGTRMFDIIGDLLSQTQVFIAQATALKARVQGQNSDVARLASEVKSTENAASGTGVLPTISQAISSTVGTAASSLTGLIWPIAVVAAVAGIVYLTAPQLMRRAK